MLNTPVAPTTAEPSSVPSAARIRTVLPGSARPVTTVPSALTASSAGAAGAVISGAVTWAGSEDTSSAMATTSSNSPLAWAGFRSMLKLPSALAMALPINAPLASRTSTREPAGAVPVSTVPSALIARLAGLSRAGVRGIS
ncbi:hypothetical protein EDP1_4197 [Pseudomonas putida S610]|nr:hypothetical protein EDP1_4197 [Pseudomonas putida S610]